MLLRRHKDRIINKKECQEVVVNIDTDKKENPEDMVNGDTLNKENQEDITTNVTNDESLIDKTEKTLEHEETKEITEPGESEVIPEEILLDGLTVKQIKEILDREGIKYSSKDNKEELIKLMKGAE